MRTLVLLVTMLASMATVLAVPEGGPQYQTDRGTVAFLRRHLLSGGEIQYPLEPRQRKQTGSMFVVMNLGRMERSSR